MKGILQYLLLLRSNGVISSNRRILSPLLTQWYYYSLNPFFSTTTQKKNPCPQISSDMAHFLETSCGFSAKKAVEILNRRSSTRLRTPHSIEKAKTVVHVLRDIGFEDAHIRKIVTNYPRFLLVCEVEKTLIPKIRILQDLGLTGPSIGKLMSKSSAILTQPISRTIEFLRKVLNNDEEVIRCLGKLGFCNYNRIQTTVERNIQILRDSGIVRDDLGALMYRFPMIFMGKSEFVDDCIGRAKHMGFDCREKMFVEALGVICHVNRSTWEKKIEMWKSYGWEEEDIVKGFRRYPRCMVVSESKVAEVLKFFTVELKHSPSELAMRSEVFRSSIKKKILPRYAVFKKLQSEGIMWKSNTKTFLTIMGMKELRFRKNVLSYLGDTFPEDYQAYLKAVDCATQSK